MTIYGYHEYPDVLSFDTNITCSEAGRVILERSLLHPGGGGQVSDQARIVTASAEAKIVGVTEEGGKYWHVLDGPVTLSGPAHIRIDETHRTTISQLHTVTHILNALVYQKFDGALVTGVHRASVS